MVAAAGAGPKPIQHEALTSEILAEAIKFCLMPEAAAAARKIAETMKSESGVQAAVASFHAHLPRDRMPCDILPDHPAAWITTKGKKRLNLSKTAVGILLEQARIDQKYLRQ